MAPMLFSLFFTDFCSSWVEIWLIIYLALIFFEKIQIF
jgi:hypothetical protein